MVSLSLFTVLVRLKMMVRKKNIISSHRYHHFIIVNKCRYCFFCMRLVYISNASTFYVRCSKSTITIETHFGFRIPHISYMFITHIHRSSSSPTSIFPFGSFCSRWVSASFLAYSLCQYRNLMFNRNDTHSASVLLSPIEPILQNRASRSQPNLFNRNRNDTIRFIERKECKEKRLSLFGNQFWLVCVSVFSVPRNLCRCNAICIMVIVFTFTLSLKFLYPHTSAHKFTNAQNHAPDILHTFTYISHSNEPKRSTRWIWRKRVLINAPSAGK